MQYRLRTLLIVLALGPLVLAGGYIWYVTPRGQMVDSAGTQVSLLTGAVDSYRIDVGDLPPDLESLLVPSPSLITPAKWQGPYLDRTSLPVDPWNSSFQYEVLGNSRKKSFRIWSNGPDGISRTRDDVGPRW